MCDAVALQLNRSNRFSGSYSDLTAVGVDSVLSSSVTYRLSHAKELSRSYEDLSRLDDSTSRSCSVSLRGGGFRC